MNCQPGKQRRRDDYIHGWTRQRDPEFLPGIIGHSFQASYSADGQERNVASLDAVLRRHQRMPELVQQHAGEEGQDEPNAGQYGVEALSLRPVDQNKKANQDQERGMHINADASERTEFPRPFHDQFLRFDETCALLWREDAPLREVLNGNLMYWSPFLTLACNIARHPLFSAGR